MPDCKTFCAHLRTRRPDLHDLQTSIRARLPNTPDLHDLQASRPLRLHACMTSTTSRPPYLHTFQHLQTYTTSRPTRPPDLHDLQTYTNSRPTRPPDLHDLQTHTTSRRPCLYAFQTSRPLRLHTCHLHKHNQAGREEKPRHSDGGQIAGISRVVGKS
jgi:hypothetical protein